jgi:hypothetical protein
MLFIDCGWSLFESLRGLFLRTCHRPNAVCLCVSAWYILAHIPALMGHGLVRTVNWQVK